jgi:serine/threonine protein kinase
VRFGFSGVRPLPPSGSSALNSQHPLKDEEPDPRSPDVAASDTTDRSGLFNSQTLAGPAASDNALMLSDLTIAGFEIIGQTGEGGMGAVLEARQTSLNRRVAVKVLSPHLALRGDIVERFDREAATLARLTHPNIVTILERGQCGKHYYFIMEFVEGPFDGIPCDLRQLIGSEKLDQAAVKRRIIQVADALAFAHSEGITHRDIKPSNIMIDRHGNVKVADFGIASSGVPGGGQLTVALSSLGTPDYMAPEQRRDAAGVDFRADIYSTGVMLYEMLTGELPMGVFEPPSQTAGVSGDWDSIVAKAMNADPAKRWQSMREFRTAVEVVRVDEVEATAGGTVSTPVVSERRSYDTEIDGLLVSADEHFERAEATSELDEAFSHAEQAGLIYARVLKTNFSDEIQKRLNAVNRLATRISRAAAKDAIKNNQLAQAVRYLECLVDLDPATRDQATKTLEKIRQARETALAEIRTLLEKGDNHAALAKTEEACHQFPDVQEFQQFADQCRQHSEVLLEFRDVQFPKLRAEKRYCELAVEAARVVEIWPEHSHLKKLSGQVAAKIEKADNLFSRASEYHRDGNVTAALKYAREAVSVVADHADAASLIDEISGVRTQLQELTDQTRQLIERSQWFTARKVLKAAEDNGLRNKYLAGVSDRVNSGCEAANRHRAFLYLVFVGGFMALLSGKLALLFLNGLFSDLQWHDYRPAIGVATNLVFTWAALLVALFAIGRRVRRPHLILCLGLLAGSAAIPWFPEIAGWEAVFPIAVFCVLFPLLPTTFASEITTEKLFGFGAVRAISGSLAAVAPLVLLIGFSDRPDTSCYEALVVGGLILVFGLSDKWWLTFPLLGAAFVSDIVVVGAAGSEFAWLIKFQGWCTGLLMAVTAIVCIGRTSKATVIGMPLIVLFVFGTGTFLRDADVVPPAAVVWSVWFATCGSVALQARHQFSFGWHLIDRFRGIQTITSKLSGKD